MSTSDADEVARLINLTRSWLYEEADARRRVYVSRHGCETTVDYRLGNGVNITHVIPDVRHHHESEAHESDRC